MQRTMVFKDENTGQEVLIIYNTEGGLKFHVAIREKRWHSWGPPMDKVEDETK